MRYVPRSLHGTSNILSFADPPSRLWKVLDDDGLQDEHPDYGNYTTISDSDNKLKDKYDDHNKRR